MSSAQMFIVLLTICCTFNLVLCRSVFLDRRRFGSANSDSVYKPFSSQSGDLQAAATGHHYGRVQIKVYRGPDSHHGGEHHEHFAPHGFWVKQPADADHHH